jgi:hypothetical protein
LTNFSNGKQTRKSLESGFLETNFREINMALMESLIQVMDSELQFQMVGIHALQQLAVPGFEHPKMNVM